jgi:hypothetical protein
MRMFSRSVLMAAAVLGFGSVAASAQQLHSSDFQCYVGGSGGFLSSATPTQARKSDPLVGFNMLVTARRTGLLLSVEQAFTDDAASGYAYSVIDTSGAAVGTATATVTFDFIRKYSAMLMAFPVRGPIAPYLGVGGGIIHTGGHKTTSGSTVDQLTTEIGSSAFASAMAGVEIRLSRFSVFGQYQITTAPSNQLEAINNGNGQVVYSGKLLRGPTHTFSAGLRVSLGSAREGIDGDR